ncbi:uncharacterized protein BXZ73DRAFT_83443 [Epithele typhae]|uniref:uncharacterized protein n=1 Tax=Epithele typhae TaxID=378194 RepID=UPI002007345F|nr:uncharacterized protein BXZ73DRAFT_83443 [Epithele typhae]KAH9910519.1 hypothetical protein BXZ73DRAFT_83443 [Epithele typhae]
MFPLDDGLPERSMVENGATLTQAPGGPPEDDQEPAVITPLSPPPHHRSSTQKSPVRTYGSAFGDLEPVDPIPEPVDPIPEPVDPIPEPVVPIPAIPDFARVLDVLVRTLTAMGDFTTALQHRDDIIIEILMTILQGPAPSSVRECKLYGVISYSLAKNMELSSRCQVDVKCLRSSCFSHLELSNTICFRYYQCESAAVLPGLFILPGCSCQHSISAHGNAAILSRGTNFHPRRTRTQDLYIPLVAAAMHTSPLYGTLLDTACEIVRRFPVALHLRPLDLRLLPILELAHKFRVHTSLPVKMRRMRTHRGALRAFSQPSPLM